MIQDPGSLANLRDLVPPDPVPLWPPAPGWFGLAAALIVFAAWTLWRARLRRHANAYRVEALSQIAQIEQGGAIERLPEVLRRAALCAFPRSDVASRVDAEWLAFLNATTFDEERVAFGPEEGALLLRTAYDPRAPKPALAARAALLEAAKRWLRDHRPLARPEAAC